MLFCFYVYVELFEANLRSCPPSSSLHGTTGPPVVESIVSVEKGVSQVNICAFVFVFAETFLVVIQGSDVSTIQ